MSSTSLKWYRDRLRSMSPNEMGFRVQQLLRSKWEKKYQVSIFPRADLLEMPTKLLEIPEISDWQFGETFWVFGKEVNFMEPLNWHLDVHNGREYPLIYGRSIDTRSEKYGVVKNVWEVNRLQFLTQIAIQYKISGDKKWLDRFVEIIESWVEDNPYLLGVNWYSNIEINLRLITWFLCWEILDVNQMVEEDPNFKEFVGTCWVPCIYLHCKYSNDHPSKFSSSNNHLISEGAGLFIGTSYWKFRESAKWNQHARKILETEIIKQHSSNGINKEEASEYIQFITDFFLISYIVGEKKGKPFSPAYANMLHQVCIYISQLMDASGHAPYYGDDDDGRTFILDDGRSHNNFASILTAGAILFEDGELKAHSAGFDQKNQFLFGEKGWEMFEALPTISPAKQSLFFEKEGHFIFKKGEGDKEIYFHFDAAPLGYLSIAAHGHADALSFFLHVDGVPMIADMGTYTYHSEPDLRAYFKGTLAHNTIRVDGRDQAENAGPCLWINHYDCVVETLVQEEEKEYIKAYHTGYEDLGIRHYREVTFDKAADTLVIEDYLENKNGVSHQYDVPFHLHPGVSFQQISPQEFVLEAEGSRNVRLILDPSLEPTVKHGEEDPLLGWHSPSFLVKQPTNVIISSTESKSSIKLKTILIIE